MRGGETFAARGRVGNVLGRFRRSPRQRDAGCAGERGAARRWQRRAYERAPLARIAPCARGRERRVRAT